MNLKFEIVFDGEDDIYEKQEFLKHLSGCKPEIIVTELDEKLRSMIKHSDKNELIKEYAEELREFIREVNTSYSCGVEF